MSCAKLLSVFFTFTFFIKSLNGNHGYRKVYADLTTNRLTREHDGSNGMWSLHGVAHASHATKTEFIFNADLLSEDGRNHLNIASMVYPMLGPTSDLDEEYLEYLILQAKTAKIDGFLVEWGFREHPSNVALEKIIAVAERHQPFEIGVNWCDHWLLQWLEQKNATDQMVSEFHRNAQYLLDTVFYTSSKRFPSVSLRPLIFLFGGGITSEQFRKVLAIGLKIPYWLDPPLWIGNYLNFAETEELWAEWGPLIDGVFGWIPSRTRVVPPSMPQWDYYGNLADTTRYQQNVSSAGEGCVRNGTCQLWCASASPGFDNRGCAGWGGTLKYLPRKWQGTSLYNAQWKYHVLNNSSANILILPTMNDYSEASVLLPTKQYGFEALYTTELFASFWKGSQSDSAGVTLPTWWFSLKKSIAFLNQTGVNITKVAAQIEDCSTKISLGSYAAAANCLEAVQLKTDMLYTHLTVDDFTLEVPNGKMYFVKPPLMKFGAYLLNTTHGLYLRMSDVMARVLLTNNYVGFLQFDYILLDNAFTRIQVYSSTKRKSTGTTFMAFPRQTTDKQYTEIIDSVEAGNFAVVCDLMNKVPGVWHHANVRLYKSNIAWDHTAPLNSDLHFKAVGGSYLVKRISLEFHVYHYDSGGK
ncbi:uncharacterized protein LOC144869345 [Branchiostoma floridae x Branchiostoma japonicum]